MIKNWLRKKLKIFLQEDQYKFEGWGLKTHTSVTDGFDRSPAALVKEFIESDRSLRSKLKRSDFVLSQFSGSEDKDLILNGLLFRHYIVFWAAKYAIKNASKTDKKVNFVEGGVCDGLTMHYALEAALGHIGSNKKRDLEVFLYDSFGGMISAYLLETELKRENDYSYLDFKQTQKNLEQYAKYIKFCPGYIPNSLSVYDGPKEDIIYLHLDLNSAIPTAAMLRHFFPRMPVGGIVLFDDYGWRGHEDAKIIINEYMNEVSEEILHLPTGQAIVIKSGNRDE